MNRPITNEIKGDQKAPPKQKSYTNGFTGKFYQKLKKRKKNKELIYLSQAVPKIQEQERAPSLFYLLTIILIPKPEKDTTKKENYRPVFLMNVVAKILNQLLANQIQQ